jgi:hypothetical protein
MYALSNKSGLNINSNENEKSYLKFLERDLYNIIVKDLRETLSNPPKLNSDEVKALSKNGIRSIKSLLESGQLEKDDASMILRFLLAEYLNAHILELYEKCDFEKYSDSKMCQLLKTID